MLETIFGSISRVKILGRLLLSPNESYQVKNLVKELKLSSPTIRGELNNLVKFGLIKEEKRPVAKSDNKKYSKIVKTFRVNQQFLLFEELRALFTKAQLLFSQKFVNDLQKICHPKFLALTGVFTDYSKSQTDILLVGTVRRRAFLTILNQLEKDLGHEINYTILSEKEFNYRERIMDVFLYGVLDGKSLILIDQIHDGRETF